MSSTLFWLFPFNRWIFLISPFFYLFFSLEIFVASGVPRELAERSLPPVDSANCFTALERWTGWPSTTR